jgi:hypothetical protein
MPAQLSEAIDREARALANGDVETILAAHMPEDQAYIYWIRTTIEPWGHPTDNGPLYTIIAFNLPTSTRPGLTLANSATEDSSVKRASISG